MKWRSKREVPLEVIEKGAERRSLESTREQAEAY